MAGKFDAAIKDLMWRGMPVLIEDARGFPHRPVPEHRLLHGQGAPARSASGTHRQKPFSCEFQAQGIQRLDWRMLDYYSVIGDKYGGVPIVQMVIYLGEKPSRMATGIDHPNLASALN